MTKLLSKLDLWLDELGIPTMTRVPVECTILDMSYEYGEDNTIYNVARECNRDEMIEKFMMFLCNHDSLNVANLHKSFEIIVKYGGKLLTMSLVYKNGFITIINTNNTVSQSLNADNSYIVA